MCWCDHCHTVFALQPFMQRYDTSFTAHQFYWFVKSKAQMWRLFLGAMPRATRIDEIPNERGEMNCTMYSVQWYNATTRHLDQILTVTAQRFANVVKPFVLTSSIIHETPSRNVNSSFCQSVILARHSLDILGGVFYFQPNFDNPLRKPSFDFQRRAR